MIKYNAKKRRVIFSGKDLIVLKRGAKETGLSVQNFFTGLCWEMVMRHAREGDFLEKAKKS